MRARNIPWVAFIPLLVGQVSEASVNYSVFPYLPSFIASLGKSSADVAFYTGLAESSLLAVEAAVALPVARLSDKWGRRPLFIATLMWLTVTCFSLGTSTSVTGIVMWRLLAGLSATRATSRTMLFELSNDDNRVSMLGFFEPAGSVGALMGRLCGGYFSEPEGRIVPFGDMDVFQRRPYLLPGIVVGVLPLMGVILSYLFLHETKAEQSKSPAHDWEASKQAIRRPGMLPLLLALAVSNSLDFACDAALALLSTISVEDGGLGLSLQAISWTLCFQSVTYMVLAPNILRMLTKRFSKIKGLTILISLWPIIVPSYILAIYHAKHARGWLPFDLVLNIVLRCIGADHRCFYDLMVMDLSSAELLASSNGWYTIAAAVGGAAGPFTFGTLFGYSTKFEAGSAGRQLVWLVVFIVMLVPLPLLRRVNRVAMSQAKHEEDVELLGSPEDDSDEDTAALRP